MIIEADSRRAALAVLGYGWRRFSFEKNDQTIATVYRSDSNSDVLYDAIGLMALPHGRGYRLDRGSGCSFKTVAEAISAIEEAALADVTCIFTGIKDN